MSFSGHRCSWYLEMSVQWFKSEISGNHFAVFLSCDSFTAWRFPPYSALTSILPWLTIKCVYFLFIWFQRYLHVNVVQCKNWFTILMPYALPSGLDVTMHKAVVLFGVSYVYFDVYHTWYRLRKVAEAQRVMCSEFDVGVGLPWWKIIYLTVPFKGVRRHLFSFSEKPNLMGNEPFSSIDCSSVDDLTVPRVCLGSQEVVIRSKAHWTFSLKLL